MKKWCTAFDYLKFNFSVAPGLTILLILGRAVNALIPTANILIFGKFLNAVMDVAASAQLTASFIQNLGLLLGLQLLTYLSNVICGFVSVQHQIRVGTAYDFCLCGKRSRLKYYLLEDPETCDLIARLSKDSTEKMHTGFCNLMDISEYVIRILGIAGTIFLANFVIGIVVLVLLILIIPIAKKCGEEDYDAYAESSSMFRRARTFQNIICSRDHAHERKVFACTEQLSDKWESWYDQGRQIAKRVTARNFLHIKAGSIFAVLVTGIIGAALLLPLGAGDISVGIYISVLTAVFSLVKLMNWNMAQLIESYIVNSEYMRDYIKLMELPEDNLDGQPAGERQTVSTIEFRNVRFRYPGRSEYVLDGLSFMMRAGRSYALVGENGAGKSTVTKLLLGLYEEYEGQILIDGVELQDIPRTRRNALFSCAFQDFARYEISLRDNVSIGAPSMASQTEIMRILDLLGLQTCVQELPNGLDTELGHLEEQGIDLSGGQWQRIAVARAVLRRAPVTIFDEPTAALDPAGELSVYHVLREEVTGIGIFISHRLGSVRSVDEIIVLDQGKLCEKGNHEELMAQKGLYAKMFELQREWYV